MAGDAPGKQNVFDFGAGADVVFDEIAAAGGRFLIYDDADVRDVAAEIPSDEFAGKVVGVVGGNGERLAFAREKDLKIRDAAMVDVGVGVSEHPAALIGVGGEIFGHVFVDFFLKVDAEGAVGADDLVGTDTGVGGDVAVGVGDFDVGRVVADGELCARDGGGGEFFEEEGFWAGTRRGLLQLGG